MHLRHSWGKCCEYATHGTAGMVLHWGLLPSIGNIIFFPRSRNSARQKGALKGGLHQLSTGCWWSVKSLFVFKNHTIFIDVGKTISQPYGLMVYTTICGNHSCSAILFVFLEAAKNHVLEALRPAMWRCIGTNFHHHVACFLLKCQLDRENYWKQTKGWNLNLTRILRSVIVWVLFESWITPKCVGVSSCPS